MADEEIDRYVDDELLPARLALIEAPCDSRSAALAKLKHKRDQMTDTGEWGLELVDDVVRWMEAAS